MYERLWRLYVTEKKLTTAHLAKAVINGWITDAQKQEILAAK